MGAFFTLSHTHLLMFRKRWCFYLNIPVGGLSMAIISVLLKPVLPLGADPTKRSWADLLHQVRNIDWVAAVLAAGSVTSLGLALQWGGNTKPWDDKAVIIVRRGL
jgi:hypothetical protein